MFIVYAQSLFRTTVITMKSLRQLLGQQTFHWELILVKYLFILYGGLYT